MKTSLQIKSIPLISPKYSLLEQEVSEGNFRSSILIIKDCWEIIMKLSSIFLYCDLWELLKDDYESSVELVNLLRPLLAKFPSMGDWLTFWVNLSLFALNGNYNNHIIFNKLVNILYGKDNKNIGRSKPTRFLKLLRSSVEWRNNIIGHGAASHSQKLLSEDITNQINNLNKILAEYQFLNEMDVISFAPKGNLVNWSSFNSLEPVSNIDKEEQYYKVYVRSQSFKLILSPLIMARVYKKHISLLTFDKLSKGILFLDYILGTKVRYSDIKKLSIYLNKLSENDRIENLDKLTSGGLLDQNAQAYSNKVTKAFDRIEFGSDISQWFVMPVHLRNELNSFVETCDTNGSGGYFHISGGAGRGKSWFTANLNNLKSFKYASEVILYHIRLGMRQNPELFISSLQYQVHSEKGHQVMGARIRLEDYNYEYDALIKFAENVIEASAQNRFILVIDGLDELIDDTSDKIRSIIDFLPPPDSLIPGLLIVISSRHKVDLRPRVKKFINFVSKHENYYQYNIDSFPEEHSSTINKFLKNKFKIDDDLIRHQIIGKSENSFLKATLFGRLYVYSNCCNIAELPDDIYNLYEIYLKDKASTIGNQLFNNLHRKLLQILSISPCALSIDQLSELLKIQEENIVFSLFDIGEFFHIERSHYNNSFELVHSELAQYIRVKNENQIITLLNEILELYFEDDTMEIMWFAETTEFLQGIAQTNLCLAICNILLEKLKPNSKYRVQLLRRAIDMDHIKGNYQRAAVSLDKLVNQLSSTNDNSSETQKEIWSSRIRQAHHMKFFAPVSKGIEILKKVLNEMPENEPLRFETEFTLYGSLGCLSYPSKDTHKQLIILAEKCSRSGDTYLLVRCLRRITDLHLFFGNTVEAMKAVKKAITLTVGTENRQGVYLNSTIAEIYRYNGDLEKSQNYHQKTIQSAGMRGLTGWQGHGHLGVGEVYRMKGDIDQAKYHMTRAEEFYQRANNLIWGLIHVEISKYLFTLRKECLTKALELAKKYGYLYDIEYLIQLATDRPKVDTHDFNNHFLLFP